MFTRLVGRADQKTGTGLESPCVLRALGSRTVLDFPLDLSESELQAVVLVLGRARRDWVQEQRKVAAVPTALC